MKLQALAHSKLNLFLEVTGKRANGYHELYSLVAFLDLADEIIIEEDSKLKFFQSGSNFSFDNNIVMRAALKLAEHLPKTKGAKITLRKNIPIGGGLGGGSCDAATTLVLLSKFWGLNLPDKKLYEIGLELGADVPVCLYSILENRNAAFFKGIGEIIEPASLPDTYFLLVNPNKFLSTEEVFKNYEFKAQLSEDFAGDFLNRRNDLQETSEKLIPEITEIINLLKNQPGCELARMTGSGSTCFGIFYNQEQVENAKILISKQKPQFFTKTSRLKN